MTLDEYIATLKDEIKLCTLRMYDRKVYFGSKKNDKIVFTCILENTKQHLKMIKEVN